ncbi:hypothetical protein JW960_11095 [candidate division KSB1 bacterium]|nr:hypothetical protein [candidate division KSB1 bacterium]
MMNQSNTFLNNVLTVVLFPLLFQDAFIAFAWGAADPTFLMLAKRLFLLLPVLAIIGSLWVTIASILTVLFRPDRQKFMISLFVTWWDLGKAVFSFWGGIFKFAMHFVFSAFGLLKILLFGVWTIILDIVFLPFRLIADFGKNLMSTSVPWIAVILTLFWCLIEATIFTYITTPLVVDVFSNITGQELTQTFARIPLFIFLLFIVLGSYAVMSTFFQYIKSKNIPTIIGIVAVEVIVIFVEVMFLYREFVDAIVPWMAQYSENFELGLFWTLTISVMVWFGIRSLSWFLFASHGTPTILKAIQGKGVDLTIQRTNTKVHLLHGFTSFMNSLKQDAEWIQTKSEELFNSFILPPLQIVAGVVNFCTLLFTGKHLFEIPFKSTSDFIKSESLFRAMTKDDKPKRPEPLTIIEDMKVRNKRIAQAEELS